MTTVKGRITLFTIVVCFSAALGGFLFGYDLSVISGTTDYLTEVYGLSEKLLGWAGSSCIIGAIFGALFAGELADLFGRKKVLMAAAILFAVSAIGSGWSEKLAFSQALSPFGWFIFYRLIGGLAVGSAGGVAPIYIAEISPTRYRGMLVTFYQLAIVIGISASYFVNYYILKAIGSETSANAWRWMFTAEVLPAGLFFVFLIFLPESPRWLVKKSRTQEALGILTRVEHAEYARAELQTIQQTLTAEHKGRVRDLLASELRLPLCAGIVLGAGSQFVGVTTVLTYAPKVLSAMGGGQEDAYFRAVLLGLTNFVCTFFPILFVDRLGRKKILCVGLILMAAALLSLGLVLRMESPPQVPTLILILAYIGAYAASVACITWVLLSEIFPNRVRGAAMSVATVSLWTACFVTTFAFPWFIATFGLTAAFFGFATACLVLLLFIWRFIPETKGKSLEEIERFLQGKSSAISRQ